MCPKYLQVYSDSELGPIENAAETREATPQTSPLLKGLVVGVARGRLVDLPHFAADPLGCLVHRGLGVADRPRARPRPLPGLLVVAGVVLARHLEEVDVPLSRGIAVHSIECVEEGWVGPEARKLNSWSDFLFIILSKQLLPETQKPPTEFAA